MPTDSIEAQWSRELREDVEIRSERGEFSLYVDGLFEVSMPTLSQIENYLSHLWLVMGENVERDGF